MNQAEWRVALYLLQELWGSAVDTVERWLREPVQVRSLRRYRPGRHKIEPHPLPEPDPMDKVHTAALRRMAVKMAPHYTLRG